MLALRRGATMEPSLNRGTIKQLVRFEPCSLHNTSVQCRQAGSSLGKPLFQFLPLTGSVTYTGLNHSGANLSNFSSNTAGWDNVTQPMWENCLLDRHSGNESMRINTSCDLPGASWWLCGNGIALKQLPGNWTGQCTMGNLLPQLLVTNQSNEMTGGIHRLWKNRLTKTTPNKALVGYSTSFHSFVRVLLPNLGIAQLGKTISSISAKIELIANSTADALRRLQTEKNSLKVVFQNLMVLDMATAKREEFVF